MNIPNLRISKKTESWIFSWLVILTQISFLPNFITNLIILVAYGFIFLVISSRLPRFIYVVLKDIFLLFLFLIAVFSVFWSENVLKTIFELRHLVYVTFFGLYLAIEYTPKDIIRFLTRICIILMILSLISVLLFPGYSLMLSETGVLSWKGVFNHKQIFGPFMGMAASIFLINCFDKTNNRWLSLFWLGFAGVLMVLSNSKTGLLMFLLSLYIMPLYKVIRQGKARHIFLVMILLIYGLIGVLLAVNLESIVVDFLGKDLEFNGRVPIWELAINSGLKQPWLGYGYNGFWTSKFAYYIISRTWAFGSQGFRDGTISFISHNGYIDLFLQLGLVGIMLFCINFIILFSRMCYLTILTRQIEYFWFFMFQIIYAINIMQGSIPLSKEIFWFVYLAMNFSSAIEYSHIRRSQNQSRLIA